MKMTTYIIIGAAILIASGIFVACNPKSESKENTTVAQSEEKTEQKENPFDGLREMALYVTAEQLGIETPEGETKVYGIVMDWDLGDRIATVSAYETGDASMYLSSGGGVIGGGQHENVRQAVSPYIQLGQEFLSKSEQTKSTPLPDKGCVRFYFLTNNGTYYAQETLKNIENENSDWLKLFEEANKVLTELRLTSEQK
ncbi:hypothetical protein E7Z59_07020 [Robertkochia marina]|uniref:Uncharacterized protein n=1 Tax=Robertkochia marina TaxID=1227945 RepID=A0A4V3UY45_9FLAO|nr:hypothetical protein [Robertkochia marina]THD67406.1 hypothetical protein E7Z59_07020 [Robertkochia marina]TRZ43061.1 hypothetical protein D3A96_11330 [Robertkochia marina]